jgi:hypothetical protein
MSINLTGLKTALGTVINTLTTKAVIWSEQNAPTPNGDYIVMKISAIRVIGATDYESKPDVNEVAVTQGDREVILSLIAVSQSSLEILLNLVDKLNLYSNLDLLCQNKLAYVGLESEPVDITTIINNSYESRSSAELIFRISKNYSSDTEDTVEAVTSIGIEGEVDGDQVKNPFTINMTVE